MTTTEVNYLKTEWTDQMYKDYETIPQAIRDIAGDLFEIKWYGFGGLEWELEHNLLGTKEKAKAMMIELGKLTPHQNNLIYHAYEA